MFLVTLQGPDCQQFLAWGFVCFWAKETWAFDHPKWDVDPQ
jgi:hypothetical protein